MLLNKMKIHHLLQMISILKGLLGLANFFAKYMHDKQLLTAGEYKSIAKHSTLALENIEKARLARLSVKPVSNGEELSDDPNNRD